MQEGKISTFYILTYFYGKNKILQCMPFLREITKYWIIKYQCLFGGGGCHEIPTGKSIGLFKYDIKSTHKED